jgi:hypothetical protein
MSNTQGQQRHGGHVQESDDDRDTGQSRSLLKAIAGVAGNETGSSTFERYLWQAKQVVRQWLACHAGDGSAEFVVCEHIEDIAVFYPERVRLLQLKTRDRGSWSTSSMCSSGLDSLVRSYNSLQASQLHENASFELWLEGPIADAKETVAFVEDPNNASNAVKTKLVALGLARPHINDFLSRLAIQPDQPTRAHIDAKIVWELSAIWPSMSRTELEVVYEKLLAIATSAQAATPRMPLARALPLVQDSLTRATAGAADAFAAIENQVLSRALLTASTPPLLGETAESLLTRIASGQGASLLELKLQAAGATAKTIESLQEMRAEMEIERQLLLASSEQGSRDLDTLASRLLTMASATASRLALASASSPASAARPAEAISADLLSRPADLAHTDRKRLFNGDERLVYGYLGHLTDECRFGWYA